MVGRAFDSGTIVKGHTQERSRPTGKLRGGFGCDNPLLGREGKDQVLATSVSQLPESPWPTQGRNTCGSREATNVEADGTHGYGARLSIRQEYRADGHAVAVVNVGRDRHQLDAGKAGGIDDLGIDGLLDLVE
jgi:hypothetical protein